LLKLKGVVKYPFVLVNDFNKIYELEQLFVKIIISKLRKGKKLY